MACKASSATCRDSRDSADSQRGKAWNLLHAAVDEEES
jgi:hypothetical protein